MPFFVFMLVFFVAAASLSAASIVSELSPTELKDLNAGKQVMRMTPMDGLPWPRAVVYQLANAAPIEVAAVFCDYENAKKFVPNLIQSKVSKKVSPLQMEVDYEIDVPILPDEFYTARNTLSKQGGESFVIQWSVIKARSIKSSEGNLKIEPYEGRSLLRYSNLVNPGSRMAGILKNHAMKQMRQTVASLVTEVETLKKHHPAKLATLEAGIAGSFPAAAPNP